MDAAQLKAIQDMLKRRTVENTASPKKARAWIIKDGVHRRDGFLINPEKRENIKPQTDK